MKVKIKVTYDEFDAEVDKIISGLMKSIGAEWYAQGFDCVGNKRDICFDLEVK